MPGPLPGDLARALAQKPRDDHLVLFAGAGQDDAGQRVNV